MKKVTIKNKDGIQTHGAQMDDPTAWIAEGVANNWWGEPESYTIEIVDISAERELQECISKRIAEYPTFGDFMNAFFDGDQQVNLDALKQARIATKQKYPKPTGGQ
jgi:hypothetical protein